MAEEHPRPECIQRFEAIEKRMDDDKSFRARLIQILVTIVLAIFIQIGTFLVMWGKVTTIVDITAKRVETIENLFPRRVQ